MIKMQNGGQKSQISDHAQEQQNFQAEFEYAMLPNMQKGNASQSKNMIDF